jgi:chemotaxis protein histidine kinase CheA
LLDVASLVAEATSPTASQLFAGVEIMNRCYLLASLVVLIASVALVGCDSGGDGGGQSMDALAAQIDQNKKADDHAAAAEQAKQEAAKRAEEKQAADEAARQQAAAEAEQAQQAAAAANAGEAATVGDLQRKNTVEGPLQYYGAISNARIIAIDRALGWQIKSALDAYVNGENDGKYPKTTEEFMEKVIKPNSIELPELEPNQEFFYDPQDNELKIAELPVEQPAAGAPQQ